ncbi:MAG TPA: MBL fold metallo-hydrolase [Acidimicrobiales bacterium]
MSEGHDHAVEVSPEAAELHEVVDGVFAWVQPDGTWWVNNAGAAVGGGAALVVDTCATETRTRLFLDALVLATDGAPIRVAVNTHHHGDHTYGNSLLPPSAVLVGHEAMRAELLADTIIDGCPPAWDPVPTWGDVRRRVPDLTTSTGVTVHVGGRRVELLHPGYTAHTAGDLVAWLPDERVLFAGDLVFHGLTPLAFAGSVDGARRALDWLAGFEPDHLVPGHGPLVAGADLAGVLGAHDRYYRLVLDTAAAGRRAGLTPLEAAQRCDLGEFAGWADAERIVLNVHRAYADAEGCELDLAAAVLDAITWNGGPLTTHVCCGT